MGNRKSGWGGGVSRDSLAVGLVTVSLPTCTGLCDFHIVNVRDRRWCRICPPVLKKDRGLRVYWSILKKKHPSPIV